MDHISNLNLPLDQQQANWAGDALRVQDASNLSGVALSLVDLCMAMNRNGLGTQAVADHPATRLFVAKLADLAGLDYHWPATAEQQALLLRDAANNPAQEEKAAA